MRFAIVGATGLVGGMMRQVLAERSLPIRSIRFLASARSAGRSVEFAGQSHPVELLRPEAFADLDVVLSSTPAGVSREFSPIAAEAGAVVIDNSSAWRMDPEVPLVVPEVNAEALARIPRGIVANPNCSTIQLVVALAPLRRLGRIQRVIVATYQASSGKGAKGLADLMAQQSALACGDVMPAPTAHVGPLAGNVLAHDWPIGSDGFSEEETKIMRETRKILADDALRVSATCARVPVHTGHSEAVTVEFDRPVSADEAREALRTAPGVTLCNAATPRDAEGRDDVLISRVRSDPSAPNSLCLWVVADNLRKGAATNAVQIAEKLVRRGAPAR